MPRRKGPVQRTANRLLAGLSADSQAQLLPLMEQVALPAGQTVLQPGDQVTANYFPLTGVMCQLIILEDGTPVEAATIGCEGFVSIESLLSTDASPYEVLCQTDVTALRIPMTRLRAVFRENPSVRDMLLRYAGVTLRCAGRAIACKMAHTLEQRLARWILMTQDRVTTETLPLTHELLGHMLGVRRASVTQAAGSLQQAGYISYHRGQIAVLDREGLLSASCEDYAGTIEDYTMLLGPPPTAP